VFNAKADVLVQQARDLRDEGARAAQKIIRGFLQNKQE
jgi:hypothetical protein